MDPRAQDSEAGITLSVADTQNKQILLLRADMTSIEMFYFMRQVKPEPIPCVAGHRIYGWHSKALTFWVPLGPHWPAHRWLFLSACQQSKRPPCSKLQLCWRMIPRCPQCTGPTDPFASDTQCRDARYSCAPLAKHLYLDSEFHL